jgi:hypothetical protein
MSEKQSRGGRPRKGGRWAKGVASLAATIGGGASSCSACGEPIDSSSWVPSVVKVRPYVVEHACKDPSDFIRALRPRCPLWRPNPKNWIFRGLSDSSWFLLPSAHRHQPWVPFRSPTPYTYFPELRPETERLEKEVALLRSFYEAANASGLALPIGAVSDNDWRRLLVLDWPPQDYLPLLALAQHHRIPTRLMDWTSRGLVAAYFAAQEPKEGSIGDEPVRLCVWALNRSFIELHGVQRDFEGEVRLASAPAASNPNLHAQSGSVYAAGVPGEGVHSDQLRQEREYP